MAFIKTSIKSQTDLVEQFAMANIYVAPAPSGVVNIHNPIIVAGWPIDVLMVAAMVPLPDRAAVKVELTQRYTMYGNGPLQVPQHPASGQAVQPPPSTGRPHSLMDMLRMRMGWRMLLPYHTNFAHVDGFERGEFVHLWIVTMDNQSVTFSDEAAMFPSDSLVTKLRLLGSSS